MTATTFQGASVFIPDGIDDTTMTFADDHVALFGRAREWRRDVPATIEQVAETANAMNLTDRADVALGKRADLVLLDCPAARPPAVQGTWVLGRPADSGWPAG